MKHKIYPFWRASPVLSLICSMVLLFGPDAGVAEETNDHEPPVVLATTKPLHSIAAFVAGEDAKVHLLLDGSVSPHVFQLKPSHIKGVSQADIVLWAGVGVERFIPSMLKNFAPDARVIELAALPQAVTYNSRGRHENLAGQQQEQIDYHLWLDPANAELLAFALARQLGEIDAVNAKQYLANAESFMKELQQTADQIQQTLVEAQGKNYVIYHDSLQYFEKAFGLGEAIVITPQPQMQAGAKRIKRLHGEVSAEPINCIFSEHQFRAPVLEVLAEDLDVQMLKIDPLASSYDAGPALYTDWLRRMAIDIAGCYQ